MNRDPLIDPESYIFSRGEHAGEEIADVAESDIDYLLWVVYESKASGDDKETIENWLFENPDYCDLVEL